MLAELVDVVIGVDTHRDSHALAIVEASVGVLVSEERVDASREGYRRALRLASRHGRRRLWAVEGSGAYGAGLARFLKERGERVLELERPVRTGSRGRAKSDALDALRWPASRSPSYAATATGRRCGCCSSAAKPRSRSAATASTSSAHSS